MTPLLLTPRLAAPMIETARLRLRPRTPGDFPVFAAMWADPEVTRFVGDQVLSEEAAWAKFVRGSGFWALLGYGCWTVETRETRDYVGDVGFGEFRRPVAPPLVGAPELGWVLAKPAWGQGYASEAVEAAVAWGEAHFGLTRQSCMINVGHDASRRVAEKCGFRETGRAVYGGDPVWLMHRPPRA